MRTCPAAVLGLLIAALTLFAAPAPPPTSTPCDLLAAHPDKPASVPGRIKIPQQDIAPALKACVAAAAMPGAPRRVLMELGRAYEFNRQPGEGAKAYRKAANAGSTSAMVGLGALYAEGNGVKRNYGEARKLFRQAADAGDPTGMDNLASMYGAGLGVPLDLTKAREWYEKAAALNLPEAVFQLALMTQDGDTGPKDDVAAKALFEKAAALGHADALERLGAYAAAGRAGPQDEQAAIAFYRQAAALGNDDAAAALKRLQCPYVLRDKDGKIAGNICFDGKN